MRKNQDYKNEALAALKGNWTPAVAVAAILFVGSMILTGPTQATSIFAPQYSAYTEIATILGSILILWPISMGYLNSLKNLSRDGNTDTFHGTFSTGFGNYGHVIAGGFLTVLFIALWSILLIIPGIIKSYAYSMTPYILAENPELSANQAIDRSRAMMKGHKFDLFYLHLSFIGWIVLCIFTLGIGLLWLMPYMYTAQASFYEDVKAEYERNAGDISGR